METVFPPEIFDFIIDYLWEDLWALRACSLTCRAWLPTTRLHMFNSVYLSGARRYLPFADLLTASATSPIGLAHYVRELTLNDAISEEAFIACLPSLALLYNVDILIVDKMPWEFLERQLTAAVFPMLKMLKLRCTSVENINSLYRFLFNHSKCKIVRIFVASYFPWSEVQQLSLPEIQTGELSLEELVLKTPSPLESHAALVSFMLRAQVHLQVRKFQWASAGKGVERDGLRDLLQRIGESLEYLSLMIYPSVCDRSGKQEDTSITNLSLAHNSHLRSLEIVCPGNRTQSRCSWVSNVLDLITPIHARLQQITFISRGSFEIYVASLDWHHIDASLARLLHMLPQLHVAFDLRKVPGHWTQAEVSEEISAKLPEARARDVSLSFVVTLLHR
ncbi:hypothetical protein BKA93DRAFT_189788 [Sparassis latifolia]